MNFSILGLLSESILGLNGLFYLMLGHAITSSALFLGIGVLYDRYKTRLMHYYSSLVIYMPIFSTIYFIFILANFGFPGTFNFVGEFLILIGLFSTSSTLFFLASLPLILTLIYSLFLYNRLFFGPIYITFIRYYCDNTFLEFIILIVLILISIVGAIYPMLILSIIN